MTDPQSFIVYSNPLEHAFWEGTLLLPFSAATLTFLLVIYVGSDWLRRNLNPLSRAHRRASTLLLLLAALAAGAVALLLA